MAKTTKRPSVTALRIDPEIMACLQAIKDETDVPISAQVRRALLAYLESKGINPEAKGKTKK